MSERLRDMTSREDRSGLHEPWRFERDLWEEPSCDACGRMIGGEAQTLLGEEDMLVCDDCLPTFRPECADA